MYKLINTKSYIYNDISYKYLKILFFTVFIFPYIVHIYWGIFDIFYANNITYIAIFIGLGMFFLNMPNVKTLFLRNEKLLSLFLLFIFTQFVNAVVLSNYHDLIKYSCYILSFYLVYSHFTSKTYFHIYINIVSFFVVINIIIYFYCLIFPFYNYFDSQNLNLLTQDSPFLTRKDWNYTIPFYLMVFPSNIDGNELGLLNLPRLFGMSTEPTMYSIVLLPTFIMSMYYKKHIQTIILLMGLLLASSYGALAISLVGILFYSLYKYKLSLFVFLIFCAIIGYQISLYAYLATLSPRINLYLNLFSSVSSISSVSLLANLPSKDIDSLQIPNALLEQIAKNGLLVGISYLGIFYFYIKYSLKENNKLLFIFSITSLLLINKSGEILSPLFLFYFSFIYSQHIKKEITI